MLKERQLLEKSAYQLELLDKKHTVIKENFLKKFKLKGLPRDIQWRM